ncbi:hypothetical protein DFH07DRAFT_759108 [Mycena maculata]|uniref:DUF6589 domain-containing protein n=1 Tax=Mycena maculata TaxID=230809 RepID=A0AAD7HMU4_9AGAR|nr:hypothetical protein DFH07DRAFT_759108 [Mycena maculata]
MAKILSSHQSVSELTPEFLRGWSLEGVEAKPADKHAPVILKILCAALDTPRALEQNKKKSNHTACYTILAQIVSRRSQYAPDFTGPMSLMWWASGCSREAIEILNNIGLSKSFDTTQLLIKSTGNYCIQAAHLLAHGPDGHLLGYDNVNLSTSIFVEQRSSGSTPAKVQSGTYAILYRLRNPNPRALELEPILLRAQNATDLDFNNDLCPSLEQSQKAHHQFCSYVIRVLSRYEGAFKGRRNDPDLQSPPRRPLPDGYKTAQFPLKICTREEGLIKGNLAVHVEIYINQLGLTYPQLTRALGIGLFHLCLNLVWAVLNVHRGHVNHHGTLAHLFVIIEKTRLGGQHPDYHSLLAALMQILDGLLLDAWRIECGFNTLAEYAAMNPSAADLRLKAATILYNHGTPTRSPSKSNGAADTVRENSKRLIHDLMYVCEVTRAISATDFGRVEDILTTLGMMFRGAGSKNYSTEIMHFTHNMKKIWDVNGFEGFNSSLP